MTVSYVLALLTHGSARTFQRTVESFRERVSPDPWEVVCFADACHADTMAGLIVPVLQEHFPDNELHVASTHPDRQAGFCSATARLWDLALDRQTEFVFWLEADFVFLRDVDLQPLARVLRDEPMLAQISLIRDACNQQEAIAGGLVASRPGEFHPRVDPEGNDWMEQRSYFTTTPSLMLRSFMARYPFLDDGLPGCEGRYGADLRARGFFFGAWGAGEEWVAHMGIRDKIGKGY